MQADEISLWLEATLGLKNVYLVLTNVIELYSMEISLFACLVPTNQDAQLNQSN